MMKIRKVEVRSFAGRLPSFLRGILAFSCIISGFGADVPNSKDPAGMKRYTGSEIIAYREPKFDEFLLPLGPPVTFGPVSYEKSLKIEGLVSRYTYLAPPGRSAAELFRNYKSEFQRLSLVSLFEKTTADKGGYGSALGDIPDEDNLGQILAYGETQERLLISKSKDSKPTYYYLFVTTYGDGLVPDRLAGILTKDRALAELIIVAPQPMEANMTLLNAEEMSRSITDTGKVLLYGINFDTGKDTLRADSEPMLKEIAKLLSDRPTLNVRIVGHTDNQGSAASNLDLSRRRSASVVSELKVKYAIAPNRLDSFGCGLYAPVASNEAEEGRAKNRRVELVTW
jgi:outer membrane protein OmpA-like peptidoglycan-associated protein